MTPIVPPASVAPIAPAGIDTVRTERLHKAAHQFEAMMLGEMLKPLAQASEDAGNGDDKTASGPLQSFGMEAVAGALSRSNALGFAQQIERALQARRTATKAVGIAPSGSEI